MPETTISLDGLIYTLRDWSRDTIERDTDLVTVALTAENPSTSLGDARHLSMVEVRDESGAAYALDTEDGWSEPLQPETAQEAQIRFRVPADVTALRLVLEPGSEDEVAVELE